MVFQPAAAGRARSARRPSTELGRGSYAPHARAARAIGMSDQRRTEASTLAIAASAGVGIEPDVGIGDPPFGRRRPWPRWSTGAAPDNASWPRWIRCQSVMQPSTARILAHRRDDDAVRPGRGRPPSKGAEEQGLAHLVLMRVSSVGRVKFGPRRRAAQAPRRRLDSDFVCAYVLHMFSSGVEASRATVPAFRSASDPAGAARPAEDGARPVSLRGGADAGRPADQVDDQRAHL